jgi:hypothetical protein
MNAGRPICVVYELRDPATLETDYTIPSAIHLYFAILECVTTGLNTLEEMSPESDAQLKPYREG